MRNLIFILFAFLTSYSSFAQTENYDTVLHNLREKYNEGQYEQIFNLFSSEMKEYLPLEKTKSFFLNLMHENGRIQQIQLIKRGVGKYVFYKTTFENDTKILMISLNHQNLIDGFEYKPYKEQTERINNLNQYPNSIAQKILEHTIDFPNHTQLSIAITENGRTNYYGVIIENDRLETIENHTKVFEIGSISKVLTSTVLAALVKEGAIQLTDDINSYYVFPFKGNNKISFINLANHTSGLPRVPSNFDFENEINPFKSYNKEKLEKYLQNDLKLDNQSSNVYNYSNFGVGLLGYTLGLSQKVNFSDLLQDRVFDRYQMKNSFTKRNDKLSEKLVKGLNEKGEIIPNWDFGAVFLGAGGVLSTTEDLMKFAIAQFDLEDKALELTRQPTFTIDDKNDIGLGWRIAESNEGNRILWHTGGTGGYSSSIAVNTTQQTAVVILSNVSAFHTESKHINNFCFELINSDLH